MIFKHCAFFETCSRASFMEVLLQEWQEIGVAPFPPRSRFNGQGSKALQEYEKCIKRGIEPGGPQLLPCRKQIFDLQRKGIELERRKSILGASQKRKFCSCSTLWTSSSSILPFDATWLLCLVASHKMATTCAGNSNWIYAPMIPKKERRKIHPFTCFVNKWNLL